MVVAGVPHSSSEMGGDVSWANILSQAMLAGGSSSTSEAIALITLKQSP